MYRQYADTVYRIAFVRTLNSVDAEDVLQEVFCRYIRFAPEFADDGHAKAWFIRAAVNCSNSLLTSAWKRRAVLGEEAGEDLTARMEQDTEVYYAVMEPFRKVCFRCVILQIFMMETLSHSGRFGWC